MCYQSRKLNYACWILFRSLHANASGKGVNPSSSTYETIAGETELPCLGVATSLRKTENLIKEGWAISVGLSCPGHTTTAIAALHVIPL